MSNAVKIRGWRDANPGVRLTVPILCELLGVANLRGANLRGANLRDANLWGANLRDANLWDANLRDANLWDANLWGGMPIQAGRSGTGYLIPTPYGWRISIGCWWNKTVENLADLVADRTEWPEASGAEREKRRPMLAAVHALCVAHIGQQPENIIDNLAAKWGVSE